VKQGYKIECFISSSHVVFSSLYMTFHSLNYVLCVHSKKRHVSAGSCAHNILKAAWNMKAALQPLWHISVYPSTFSFHITKTLCVPWTTRSAQLQCFIWIVLQGTRTAAFC